MVIVATSVQTITTVALKVNARIVQLSPFRWDTGEKRRYREPWSVLVRGRSSLPSSLVGLSGRSRC
jgi:hypothetical protein